MPNMCDTMNVVLVRKFIPLYVRDITHKQLYVLSPSEKNKSNIFRVGENKILTSGQKLIKWKQQQNSKQSNKGIVF